MIKRGKEGDSVLLRMLGHRDHPGSQERAVCFPVRFHIS